MTKTTARLTLTQKHEALRSTVAVPEDHDWQLLVQDESKRLAIVAELNDALCEALEVVKAQPPHTYMWGDIAKEIWSRIDRLQANYPDAGISDSEGCATVARFFALNWEPAMYGFLRYRTDW